MILSLGIVILDNKEEEDNIKGSREETGDRNLNFLDQEKRNNNRKKEEKMNAWDHFY